jgi:hypothetical protein
MTFKLPFPQFISSVPDFLMGAAFLATWIDPYALGDGMLPYLLLVMLLEFIIIHSSAFIGNIMYGDLSKQKKITMMLGFFGFYTLFVLAFSLGFGEWWPIVAFTGLMLNRMLSVLVGNLPEGEERERVKSMWAVNVLCYIVGVFATILLPIPAMGITPEVISQAGLTGEGIWVEEPYRLAAFGFLYFTAVGYIELTIERRLHVQKPSGEKREI